MTHLKLGDAIPTFSLACDNGEVISPVTLRGRPAVIYFYPEDDSGGCVEENVEFSALLSEFESRGATLIGVSPDDVESHAKFRAKYGLLPRLGADPERAMIEAFGLWQLKKLYGREFMGLVRTSFVINTEGKIASIMRATRIKGHAAKVLAALDEVLAQKRQ